MHASWHLNWLCARNLHHLKSIPLCACVLLLRFKIKIMLFFWPQNCRLYKEIWFKKQILSVTVMQVNSRQQWFIFIGGKNKMRNKEKIFWRRQEVHNPTKRLDFKWYTFRAPSKFRSSLAWTATKLSFQQFQAYEVI